MNAKIKKYGTQDRPSIWRSNYPYVFSYADQFIDYIQVSDLDQTKLTLVFQTGQSRVVDEVLLNQINVWDVKFVE